MQPQWLESIVQEIGADSEISGILVTILTTDVGALLGSRLLCGRMPSVWTRS